MRTLKDYVLFILSLIVVIWISLNWAKADTWVMNKVEPLDGEVMQIKSAPVTDVYINDIHEKVQKKLKLLNENEKKGILKETTLDRFERDGQWLSLIHISEPTRPY